MKNKILTGVLTTALLVTSVGYISKYNESEDLKSIIEEQKANSKRQSTEIARLESVIEQKDIILIEKEMVIENKNIEINELKVENNKLIEENERLRKNQNTNNETPLKTITVNASAYTAFCSEGCTGKTRSGYNVSNTIYYEGMRIIATDLNVLPMYSIVKIEGFNEKFIVLDTGGAIKGNKIDILFKSNSEALKFGRKNVKLEVIRYGK